MSNKSVRLLVLALALSCALLHGGMNAQEVARADHMVEQWLSLERQNSSLESDWQTQKPLLAQRLSLLEIEKKQLEAMLNEKSTDSSEVEQKRLTLIQEQSELEVNQDKLTQGVNLLLGQLSGLQPLLPNPLLQSWQQENANLTESSLISEQLQVALAQLNKLAEFDQRISVVQQTLFNPQGDQVVVKQFYLGAGLAWFVSLDGTYAGSGQVTESGWEWTFDDKMDSSEISRAIAIFEKQAEADFVQLPLKLSSAGSR
ncbi:DUF3450 family protein [Paraglaciecola hydrolytica]|uniref:DUF3450 domain-containing protein n=1 Tax=Paraglaciecola hydrolytica TaxID=1799789 RepID=A0A148KN04_9ALTE|nr:DUF3450 family protein [Paraglaciecola hydrolytica]KXI27703.1 hypothetical protein AX660_19315 [Paraglaciecola hydrolytica]